MPTPLDAVLKTCSIEPVWFVRTELSQEDDNDDRVRDAVMNAVGLAYGAHYDRVCFESGTGTQFFRTKAGSIEGETGSAQALPARALTFSIPRDAELLAIAIETIREYHSYEEPVIYIQDGYATRSDYPQDDSNPNRWNNRGSSPETG